MSSKAPIAFAAAAAVSGIVLAGCGSGGTSASSSAPASQPASTPSSAPAATGGASSPAPAASPTTAAAGGGGAPEMPAGTKACTAAALKVSYNNSSQVRGDLDGMNHQDSIVVFTNTGSVTCTTGGFPGVALLNSAGQQIKQATRAGGTGVVVVLHPGGTASAQLSADSASCTKPTSVPGLLVTAPNQRTSVKLGAPEGPLCPDSAEIGRLYPGSTANLNL